MRRRVVVGAVLAVGFLAAGPSFAGPERARVVSEQELPPVYAQGVARAGERWIVSGMNVLARLTDDLEVDGSAAIPPDWAARGYNHVGDVDVAGGLVYAPFEQPDYELGVQATATYDAADLHFVDADLHALTISKAINPVYFGHFAVGEPTPPATDAPDTAARPSVSDDLDPGWPPVLIGAVLAVLIGALVIGVTFYRRARAAARGE